MANSFGAPFGYCTAENLFELTEIIPDFRRIRSIPGDSGRIRDCGDGVRRILGQAQASPPRAGATGNDSSRHQSTGVFSGFRRIRSIPVDSGRKRDCDDEFRDRLALLPDEWQAPLLHLPQPFEAAHAIRGVTLALTFDSFVRE